MGAVKCEIAYYIQQKNYDMIPDNLDYSELNLIQSTSPPAFEANNLPFRWAIHPAEGEALRYSEEKKALYERLIRSSKNQLQFCLSEGYYRPLINQLQRVAWSLYFSRICQNQTRRDESKKLDWLFNSLKSGHRKRVHHSLFYPVELVIANQSERSSAHDYTFHRVNSYDPPDIEKIYFVSDVEGSTCCYRSDH
eukprot:TRINITY_DN7688_c0_g1_i1.p1 TRINITY_DN7688_c0_g1~~TRINITY_DN7688_c0_g1_i1.p1  ORF type:complete len:194 (+),score=23.66 TRINITY_DN7688_c0_g1_i1:179-760(+)